MSKKIILFAAVCLLSGTARAEAPELLRVTPSGKNVTELTQIVFQFDKAMTALGNMNAEAEDIPVTISPSVNCSWRWLNTTALACRLKQKDELKLATRYDITVGEGFKALDGGVSKKGGKYFIETKRPELWYVNERPAKMKSPRRPVWNAVFRPAATLGSVERHLYFSVGGERVALEAWPAEGCFDGSCSSFYVTPVKDLEKGVSYEVVYEAGFEAENGGSLKSERSGVSKKASSLPDYRVEGLQCYDKSYSSLSVSPEESVKKPPECRYGSPVYVVFSDITVGEYKTDAGTRKIDSLVKVSPSAFIADSLEYGETRLPLTGMREGNVYTVTLSPEIADRWGDTLKKETTLAFKIADRDPNLEIPDTAAVLEAAENTDLTGYAANLNGVEVDYKTFTAGGTSAGTYKIPEIRPEIRNVQYAFDAGVRTMLDGRTGYLTGIYKTLPVLRGDRKFAVSVSPWQVVAKFGHFNSLVQVVDFKTGKPVDGASVEVVRVQGGGDVTPENGRLAATAQTDGNGTATFGGYSSFDGGYPEFAQWSSKQKYFLTVKKGNDLAVMPLTWDFSVWASSYASGDDILSSYDLSPDMHMKSWGVTAQGVYRQGDTVQYKVYVRNENLFDFSAAPQGEYTLTIVDPTGKTVMERRTDLSEFGSVDGEYKLPEGSVSGWYDVNLKYKDRNMRPMRFLVGDFTPSPFKVSVAVNSRKLTAGQDVKIDTSAALFSGGAYADAPVRRTAVLSYAPFVFKNKDYADRRFSFEQEAKAGMYSDTVLNDGEYRLDKQGRHSLSLTIPPSDKPHGFIRFESSVSDDGGRKTSASETAEFFNTDLFIGVRMKDWSARTGKPVAAEFVVSDRDSRTVADAPVSISFLLHKNKYVREMSGGNAYVSRYVNEREKVAECNAPRTDGEGDCSFTPTEAGLYDVVASVTDKKGRKHESRTSFYVAGSGYVVWETDENRRLGLVPEKESYKAGETLKLLIKNPVPDAIALVTVERYGILYSSVETLKDSAAVVEIPVTKDFFPGVYVSVSLFSNRVDQPVKGDADLGKPAEWIGYVKIPVSDDSKKIDVAVTSDKQEYRPRQKAKINLKVSLPDGKKEKTEAAVVILDEAVLSLLPKGAGAYDPYKGFYTLGGLDVKTYSLISRLVGRRNIEKKGDNQGGDGGSDFAVRDLFKYVGYWNPSVVLDKDGTASFEAELPDNLTGWRVLAMVVDKGGLMGAGETRFAVNRPLEIRSLLPNQVRTTDVFSPAVSVFNRSKSARKIKLSMTATGALQSPFSFEKEIRLEPSERTSVFFDGMRAFLPAEKRKGEISMTFKAVSGEESDGLSVRLPVLNLTTMQTAAEYGSSTEDVTVPLLVPENVGVFGGTLDVSASATVLNGMEKLIERMRDYPYSCWEQKMSRALSAAVYLKIKDAVSDRDLWPDADAFVREVLEKAPSYQAPNGGMAYYQAKNEYVSPYLSAYTGFVFLRLKLAGYEIDPYVEAKLKEYLYALFRNTPDDMNPNVLRTVRLMSMPYLASVDKTLIVSCDFDVMMRDLPVMTVFEKALFLQAASMKPAYGKIAAEIRESLYGNVNLSSGTALFQELETSFFAALLSSSARNNCAVLQALSAYGKDSDHADIAEKLAGGVEGLRRKDGTWGNTQANAFCLAALYGYTAAFEAEPVDMSVKVRMENETLLSGTFKGKSSKPVQALKSLTSDDAGDKTLAFEKNGTGRYYYKTVLTYPAVNGEPVLAGMEVRRSYSVERNGQFIPVTSDTVLKRGELVKVTLDVSNPASRTFVVLSDPVPGALEPVNRDLATSSKFDADRGDVSEGSFWSGFYFRETGHSAVNFYAETLEKGDYRLGYAAQVVADGKFNAFPAKVEAMYDPDIFGLGAAEKITVGDVVVQGEAGRVPEAEQETEDFLPGAIVTGREAAGNEAGGLIGGISSEADAAQELASGSAAVAEDGENDASDAAVLPEKEKPVSFLKRLLDKLGFSKE